MKTIYFIIFMSFFSTIMAQNYEFSDNVIIDPNLIPELKSGSECYNPNGPDIIIRVNIHFMLKDDGTGNFSETSDDHITNTGYNGYKYAEDLIRRANAKCSYNVDMNHQPIPPAPVIAKKFKFILSGVYFHRNTSEFDQSSSSCGFSNYAYNEGEVINVFLGKKPSYSSAGGCTYLFDDKIGFHGHRELYERSLSEGEWLNDLASNGVVHEIGHDFGLLHPIRHDCGACCDTIPVPNECASGYCDDGCDDTPTWQELVARGNPSPCDWNTQYSSNNLMDYNASSEALSPCQIYKFHNTACNSKKSYQSCYYKTDILNITSFTENKSYIAKTVNIPVGSKITVSNNLGMFVNAEEFIINGELEIQTGSVLSVNTTPSCN